MMVMMGYEADVPYTSVMDDPFLPFFPEPNFGRVRAPHSRADPLERLWLERNAFRKHLLPFVHEMFGPEVEGLRKKLLACWQDDGMQSTENDTARLSTINNDCQGMHVFIIFEDPP
jgi:hypothetical protein